MDSNETSLFRQYANDKLNNHLAELNTRYENEKIDKETKQRAYEDHKKTFSKELDEKIQALLKNKNDSGLQTELENIKESYLSKLDYTEA